MSSLHPRGVHRRGRPQPWSQWASPGRPASVAYRFAGQWRRSSGTGAAKQLERVGFGPSDHIVTHCEGGGRAALAAAAAVRAGYDDVRVYYLSFADWVRDESCPIVRD
ncbi:MAG TPA: rhodanese-like domain-containing protein [Stellaceae bacterium]|nr:rhodanese-like domain-containing protein [Stellaceae bacterium]